MSRIVLDAGAFVAFERGDLRLRARLAAARRLGFEIATTAPVVGQVWRDGRRQALLAKLVAATRIDAPDAAAAKRAGEMLARTKTSDVVDALVADLARDGDTVLTSDDRDLRRLVTSRGVDAVVERV